MWHWLMRSGRARAEMDRTGSAAPRRGQGLIVLLTGFALGLVILLAPAPSAAQTTQRPSIEVASAVTADAGETRLAISITRPEGMPRGSFIRIRGLPAGSSMTEGFAIAPSLWAVPLNSLSNLRIKLTQSLKSDVPLTIALATVDGDVLAEARATLRPGGLGNAPPPSAPNANGATTRAAALIPPAPSPARPPAAAIDQSEPPPPPPDAASAAEELPLTDEQVRALGFITRAREQLAEGNVAIARLLFERAAKVGLAYGALGLAETYDPLELSRQKVMGIAPDLETARNWYRQASKLGAPEADERMSRLNGR